MVRVGPHISFVISLSICFLQGCVLSPLLFTVYTHPGHNIVKFADNTTVVGLISGGDESAYWDEVEPSFLWC